MYRLIKTLTDYRPVNEQEARDRKRMLDYMKDHADCLTRSDENAHFTASAWIINREKTEVCFVYHKIYDSWSWVGGHADGEENLLSVAEREAEEETGLHVTPVCSEPASVEILTVQGHEKKGRYVSSHLHFNVTYLFYGDKNEELRIKPDENAGVRWFSFDNALRASTEPWMVERIYKKLITVSNGGI